jgi:ribonuclease P protein component
MQVEKKYLFCRLRKAGEISTLFENGKTSSSKTVTVKLMLNNDNTAGRSKPKQIKFAAISPKRTGNAVERNRIRRRIRAAVRDIDEENIPNCTLAVIGRRAILKAGYNRLKEDIKNAIKNILSAK